MVLTEIVSMSRETPDVLAFHWNSSLIIECKTSRADFAADKKKWFRVHQEEGMGNQRYFMVPEGLVSLSEVPEGWGLIEVDEKKRTRVTKQCAYGQANAKAEVAVLLSFIRRLKIDPGRHAKIRVYTILGSSEPRATATINEVEDPCEGGEEGKEDHGDSRVRDVREGVQVLGDDRREERPALPGGSD